MYTCLPAPSSENTETSFGMPRSGGGRVNIANLPAVSRRGSSFSRVPLPDPTTARTLAKFPRNSAGPSCVANGYRPRARPPIPCPSSQENRPWGALSSPVRPGVSTPIEKKSPIRRAMGRDPPGIAGNSRRSTRPECPGIPSVPHDRPGRRPGDARAHPRAGRSRSRTGSARPPAPPPAVPPRAAPGPPRHSR